MKALIFVALCVVMPVAFLWVAVLLFASWGIVFVAVAFLTLLWL